MTNESLILFKSNNLISLPDNSEFRVDPNYPYYQVKLINTFGVIVDKPWLLTKDHVQLFMDQFHEKVPKSFYENPQDLKYYSCEELLLEQLVSYIRIELNGVNSLDPEVFERVPLFKKVTPNYEESKEFILRNYKIITSEEEKINILKEYASSLVSYTRPWSASEKEDFIFIFCNYCYNNDSFLTLDCKDNILSLFSYFQDYTIVLKGLSVFKSAEVIAAKLITLARQLDKKDIVKYSIALLSESSKIKLSSDQKSRFKVLIDNVKNCPLTRKQAKYYNTICKKVYPNYKKVNNNESPYKKALALIKEGKIVDAAKVFAKNGSLLERNLVFLLSRATSETEVDQIIELVSVKNPIVLNQLINKISKDTYNNTRNFNFISNGLTKNHRETSYELTWRKSKLTDSIKKRLIKCASYKLEEYYKNKPKIGKVYLSDSLKKVPLPVNTSNTNDGLGIRPVGSRMPLLEGDCVRAFVHWTDVYDIDLSIIYQTTSGERGHVNFSNYPSLKSKFNRNILFSGDCRGQNGAEYFDLNLTNLYNEYNIKYILLCANGYGGSLDCGETFMGYLVLSDLNKKVWNPKNIAMQLQVVGKTRSYISFALDVETKELIVLNQLLANDNRVISDNLVDYVQPYLDPLPEEAMTLYKVLSYQASEIVEDPKEADIVFEDNYIMSADVINKNQKVISLSEISKLITFIQ